MAAWLLLVSPKLQPFTRTTERQIVQPNPTFNLWDDLQQLLVFHFMQNAFEAGAIVAVLGGVVGYFMVIRGQSFAGHTLSQVGFPGAAGAVLVGAPPLLGLLVFCGGGALAISVLSRDESRERRFQTAAIGSILAFSIALGYLFVRLYPGYTNTALSFLFGTFLGIDDSQVLLLLCVAIVCLGALAVIGRPLLFASVDPDVAAARGVPVRALSVAFLVLLGLSVAACALITGTLLVFALLVAPAATAQQFTARPALALALSVLIALAVTWLGLSLAYFSIYPIGFFVTSLAFGVYLLARVTRGLRRRRVRSDFKVAIA